MRERRDRQTDREREEERRKEGGRGGRKGRMKKRKQGRNRREKESKRGRKAENARKKKVGIIHIWYSTLVEEEAQTTAESLSSLPSFIRRSILESPDLTPKYPFPSSSQKRLFCCS